MTAAAPLPALERSVMHPPALPRPKQPRSKSGGLWSTSPPSSLDLPGADSLSVASTRTPMASSPLTTSWSTGEMVSYSRRRRSSKRFKTASSTINREALDHSSAIPLCKAPAPVTRSSSAQHLAPGLELLGRLPQSFSSIFGCAQKHHSRPSPSKSVHSPGSPPEGPGQSTK